MQPRYILVTGTAPLALASPLCLFGSLGLGCPFQPTSSKGGSQWRLKPNHFTWLPPGPGDVRSPCPTLNTLANHGFLPHNGRNITADIVTKALSDGMNIASDLALAAFEPALGTNPEPNAKFLDLDMLHLHNVIEHDGSMSRRDEYFDPTNPFDEETFNNFLAYFGNSATLDVPSMANARARHAFEMSRINPTFNITESTLPRIFGETALMLAIWGSLDNPVAKRSYFEYFFRNERLPVVLNWMPSEAPITFAGIGKIAKDLISQSPPDVPLTIERQTTQ